MGHLFLTIYRESVLPLAIWPQVVGATHVVVMLMCDKECIQIALTMKPQHLLAEIRPAVNQNILTAYLHNGRSTHAAVGRIGRATHLAVAVQLGNTCRGAGAEKNQSHSEKSVISETNAGDPANGRFSEAGRPQTRGSGHPCNSTAHKPRNGYGRGRCLPVNLWRELPPALSCRRRDVC